MSSVTLLLCFSLCTAFYVGRAQTANTAQTADTTQPLRTVFVVRPNRYIGALAKIKVGINSKEVSLSNDTYAMTTFRADSVIAQLLNTRLSGQSAKPLVSFKDTSYFVTLPEEHATKKNRLILVEIDKESYLFYAQKVSKQEAIE
jgi:hypothetical protein